MKFFLMWTFNALDLSLVALLLFVILVGAHLWRVLYCLPCFFSCSKILFFISFLINQFELVLMVLAQVTFNVMGLSFWLFEYFCIIIDGVLRRRRSTVCSSCHSQMLLSFFLLLLLQHLSPFPPGPTSVCRVKATVPSSQALCSTLVHRAICFHCPGSQATWNPPYSLCPTPQKDLQVSSVFLFHSTCYLISCF